MSFLPEKNPPPYKALNDEMRGRGQTLEQVAKGSRLGIRTVTAVFSGSQPIDRDIAYGLAQYWKMDHKFFVRLQETYDYYKALGVPDN